MMDQKDFDKMRAQVLPDAVIGIQEHFEYIQDSTSPDAETSEVIVRNTLEEVCKHIKQFLIDNYDFVKSDFDNFPTIDKLCWHKDGWTITKGIARHYSEYNKIYLHKIEDIIENESERLCYSVFDEGNERANRFSYVKISGEDRCGNCGVYYGDFPTYKKDYTLPPYHKQCGCWAVYHD